MALPQLNAARYKTVIPSTEKVIEYRPYLVKEEKILMLAMESNDQQQMIGAIKDVLRNCIYDDIDTEKLAMFDLEFLFLQLRSKSVGESILLKAKCEACEGLTDVEINIGDVDPPASKEGNGNVIELTKNIGITLRYPTIKDVEGFKEDDLKSIDGLVKLIIQLIDTIYDEDNVYDAAQESEKDLVEFIDGFNNDQFMKVAKFFEDLPALTYDMVYDCANCGVKNETEIRGLQSFFS